jgi:hypothetical protein
MDIAISKKQNCFRKYDKVTSLAIVDEDLITFEVSEYGYIRHQQGYKQKGWKRTLRTMELKDFYNYFTVLESGILNEFLINKNNEV